MNHSRTAKRTPGLARAAAAALLLALGVGLALSACRGKPTPPKRAEALQGQAFGPVVDSLVIPPFERGFGVQINAPDLNLFREQLEAQVVGSGRKAFPVAPTSFANTATLTGTLIGYEARDQQAEGMFLRTIDMVVGVNVRIGTEKEPAVRLVRAYSYQKLYQSAQGVPALEFDLRNAAKEATGVIAGVLVPGKPQIPRLEAAIDNASGTNYSHPWLVRGNREAGFERYDRAIGFWSLLLFNPERDIQEDRYRVSDRTVAHLQQVGAPEKDLAALRPLARRDSESLEDLRERVVKALGPNSPLEAKVLQLSDENADRAQLNLARAHYNLSSLYLRFRQYDAGAFHLSRAYGYDPKPDYLDAWMVLQMQRDVIPKALQGRPAEGAQWLYAYQRVPAPFTVTVAGGAYDKTVMPPLAFQPGTSPERMPPPSTPAVMPAALPLPAQPGAGRQPKVEGAPGQKPRVFGQPPPPIGPRQPQKPAQRLGY